MANKVAAKEIEVQREYALLNRQLEARLAESERDLKALELYKQGGVLDFAGINVTLRDKLTAANERVRELEGRLHEITRDWPHIKFKDEFTVATNPSDSEIAGPRE